MKYVIIGNSAAAVGAIESIRRLDKNGSITVISSEAHHTYSRPLISYMLMGKVSQQQMSYRGESFYTDNNCTLLAPCKAESIDKDKQLVMLEGGKSISYDRLLVCTGSSPFVPPVEGLEKVKNKFTFYTLDDATALQAALTPSSRVLIVGAGLIGLKCAEGILGRVGSITVVDLADRVLSSILDDKASGIIKTYLEQNGIAFHLGTSVECFAANSATLKTGEEIPFDIVVMAVGVRPNTELVKAIGGAVGRGISVDNCMRTSVNNIYAAGDCTESTDISCGQTRVLAILPNAYMQGECAGANMAGGTESFDKAIPFNAIGFLGMHIVSAGSYSGESYTENENDCYKRLFYENDRLCGYIMLGDIARAGIYTSLIRERTPLSTIDFELICKTPALMAFTTEARAQKLGGVK